MRIVLNGHSSRSFPINSGFPWTLLVDVQDVINCKIDIYADEPLTYFCHRGNCDRFDKSRLADILEIR